MKNMCVLLCILVSSVGYSQDNADKVKKVFKPSSLSGYFGYGSRGLSLRFDVAVYKINNDKLHTGTNLYVDMSYRGIKFKEQNFNFNYINYPSKVFLLTFSCGVSQEFVISRFTIQPYLGIRYHYVRFKDRSLVEEIGSRGIIRYTDLTYTETVGPEVDNGYGNALGFEIGTRLGVIITPWLEINGTFGYDPIKFSTASSLFGPYRGEYPYKNDYYVKVIPAKLEGAVRFTIGRK